MDFALFYVPLMHFGVNCMSSDSITIDKQRRQYQGGYFSHTIYDDFSISFLNISFFRPNYS